MNMWLTTDLGLAADARIPSWVSKSTVSRRSAIDLKPKQLPLSSRMRAPAPLCFARNRGMRVSCFAVRARCALEAQASDQVSRH